MENKIDPYDWTVENRQGNKHTNADFMSCRPMTATEVPVVTAEGSDPHQSLLDKSCHQSPPKSGPFRILLRLGSDGGAIGLDYKLLDQRDTRAKPKLYQQFTILRRIPGIDPGLTHETHGQLFQLVQEGRCTDDKAKGHYGGRCPIFLRVPADKVTGLIDVTLESFSLYRFNTKGPTSIPQGLSALSLP
ncbi:hypothetical protein EYF80_009649 [Liparis tanakae]|uniref:Uncharacterized protein n=1 Tax=Liparis tanakae TaxID=230148 RepID=A0A4Z2IRA2_9TELE|nr:hypothetical protein EYF80_009649 [Liparis tanakae]